MSAIDKASKLTSHIITLNECYLSAPEDSPLRVTISAGTYTAEVSVRRIDGIPGNLVLLILNAAIDTAYKCGVKSTGEVYAVFNNS